MSKARDIANILSANTSIATDAEVTAAVSAATSGLATSSSVSSAVSTHATAANGHIGRGTTGQRPASPSIGDTYFDTTLSALISYKSAGWEKVSQDPAPQIASISPTTAATTGTTITITGSSLKSGLSVQFIGADSTVYNSPVSTFVNGTTATATTPALSVANEPYDVKIINNDNQFAILENALDAGGSPTWITAPGTIATINEQSALNVSVSATDPDGTSIVYSSTNLPVATPTPVTFTVTNSGSGAYLINGVSNGAITLTRGGTYTFNVNASGHPFYIQTTGNGYNSSNVYSTGVTGAGAQVGTVTFVVPNDAPNTLFYQCQYHSAMFGQINVVSATSWITLNSSTGALTGTSPDISSSTTYTFNVSASDGTNSTSREFSILVNPYPSVTGGTATSDATYFYRRITSTSQVVVSNSTLVADVLVVAGGGGGGVNNAGGGGGGGVVYYEGYTFTPGSYQANIGTGGLGFIGGNTNNWGARGLDSTFIGITALGGGGGEGGNPISPAQSPVKNGGSGGGGSRGISPGSATQTNSGGGVGFGNNGAASVVNPLGGGGGGAGGSGTGANGGLGKTYWGFTVGAGGGGGAEGSGHTAGLGGSSVGGSGGAGNGASYASGWTSPSGQDAVANTGSGGGGESAGFQAPGRAGNGSDGVVIIRYTKSQVGA